MVQSKLGHYIIRRPGSRYLKSYSIWKPKEVEWTEDREQAVRFTSKEAAEAWLRFTDRGFKFFSVEEVE